MDPLNEYSMVSDNQREPISPGYKLEQNNVLYADQFAAQEMKHATLTRSGQHKYTGIHTKDIEEPSEPVCNGGCSSAVMGLCVFATLVLAIAALLMVVLIIVGVIPVCSCAASEWPPRLASIILVSTHNISSVERECRY